MKILRTILAALALSLVVVTPASATLTTNVRTVTIAGTGGTQFTVTYPFQLATDLTVKKRTIATGVTVTLTQGPDYSVQLPAGSILGKVNTTAAVSSSFQIIITRNVPYTQPTVLAPQGVYNATTIEQTFDRQEMQIQQLIAGVAVDSNITTAIDAHSGAADPHTGYHLVAGRAGGQFATGGTAPSENLTLRSTSNLTKGSILFGTSAYDEATQRLGIGTTTPTVAVDVVGDGIFNHVKLSTSGSAARISNTGMGSSLQLYGGTTAGSAGFIIIDSAGNVAIESPQILVTSSTSGNDILSLTDADGLSANELGLMTVSLIGNGTIYGGNDAAAQLTIRSTSDATKGRINLGSGQAYFNDSNNSLHLHSTTAGDPTVAATFVLSVSNNGSSNKTSSYVACTANTTDCIAGRLDAGLNVPAVTGDITWLSLNDGNGDALAKIQYTSSSPFAAFAAASDERLKKNIAPSEVDGLATINAIPLVQYDWRDESRPHQSIGYVAQDLIDVWPPMVSYSDSEDLYMVADSTLTPVLVKSVQELSTELDDLKARLARLEAACSK